MPAFAFVLQFKDDEGAGWSERLWYNGATDPATILSVFTTLANFRVGFLANDCTLLRCRVQTAIKRNPRVITANAGAGLPGTWFDKQEPGEVRLLIKFSATSNGYNKIFFGGIPDDQVTAGKYAPTPTYAGLVKQYTDYIKGNSFWVCYSTLGSDPTRFDMTDLTPLPRRGYRFLTSTTVAVGDSIRVHQAREFGYNGNKTVTLFVPGGGGGAPNIVNVGGAAPTSDEPVPTGAYLTKNNYTFEPIVDVDIEGLTSHRTGRPFGPPAGRRSTTLPLRS